MPTFDETMSKTREEMEAEIAKMQPEIEQLKAALVHAGIAKVWLATKKEYDDLLARVKAATEELKTL
jgi:hypothetical protein